MSKNNEERIVKALSQLIDDVVPLEYLEEEDGNEVFQRAYDHAINTLQKYRAYSDLEDHAEHFIVLMTLRLLLMLTMRVI
jgi:hypothetical protein